MASDTKEIGVVLEEILTNFLSTLDMQAASQLSYLLHSTQTVKHVAISIHVTTLLC
jgi:hypothetical protein